MQFLQCFLTALGSLWTHKLRAVLTMIGIIIGIGAVIAMVSLTEGLRYAVVHEFESLGSDLIFVVYAPEERETGERRGVFKGLTMDDAEAIKADCELVGNVAPQIEFQAKVKHLQKERQYRITGVTETFNQVINLTVARGRGLTREDVRGWRRVCVIGVKVVEDLFEPDEDPLGQELQFSGIRFRIVGILEKKGKAFGEDRDSVVYVPLTVVQKRLIGLDVVGVIFAKSVSSAMVEKAADQIWHFLWRRHENVEDFVVDSQASVLKSFGRILTIMSLVVSGIVGISLLVGGIGIMNIMLVTVTERTREIGLRKALGAKRRDILVQFLIEAMTLSAIGGAIGIACGWGLSQLAGYFITKSEALPFSTHVPLWAVLLALGFASAVGLFFGLWPAYRAARLDPIEALRHE